MESSDEILYRPIPEEIRVLLVPGADLRRADLEGADLAGLDLAGANLRGANLRGANLRRANLREANLRGADLREANLKWAYLTGADLRGANLRGADLRGAYLRGADLRGAYLTWADLEGADLRRANLRGAHLARANLRGAKLFMADLEGADLKWADLAGANLRGADLRGANLNMADLEGADLEGVNLRGAIISNIKVVAPISNEITDLTSLADKVFAACVTPKRAEENEIENKIEREAKADQDALKQLRENFMEYQKLLAQSDNTNITYQAKLIEEKIVGVLKEFALDTIKAFDNIFKVYGDNLTNFITNNSREDGGLGEKMFEAIQLRINLGNQKHDSQQLR